MRADYLLKTGPVVIAAAYAWWAFGPDYFLRSCASQTSSLPACSAASFRAAGEAARSAARFIPRTLQNTGGFDA